MRILHVLPHPGGGAETYLDLLARMPEAEQERRSLSATRSPAAAPFAIARGLPALRQAARAADVVNVHGDTASMLAVPFLRAHRVVLTTHGLSMLRRVRPPVRVVARRRYRAAAAVAARVVCTSAQERRELAALLPGGLHDRMVVVPPAIDLPEPAPPAARGRARAELGLADGELAVLYVGRLDRWKDPLTAVAAAERAPVLLLVVGDGPLEAQVAARAGEHVRPLGFREELGPLFDAADAFVLPSRREGTSMALLEAMGRGLPVVVSDGLGNPDAAGNAGLVVPRGDPAAFAAAFERLAGDAALRARLGAAARARVEAEYSTPRLLARMRAVFEDAAATPVR